jgi:hypothetical protein
VTASGPPSSEAVSIRRHMATPPRIPQRPSVSVRLSVSTTERLDDLARAMGRRRSDVLRRAVDDLLDRLAKGETA